MAKVGLKVFAYAPISSYTPGSAITYSGGKVFEGLPRVANVSFERDSSKFYAGDIEYDHEDRITGFSLETEISGLTDAEQAALLGYVAHTTGTGTTTTDYYRVTDAEAPFVGFGYVGVNREKGVTSYEGVVCHRISFVKNNDNRQTKEQNIQWNGETMTGTGTAVQLDSSGANDYIARMSFTSYASALAWIKSMLSIT